jgi:CheY-like chemotaxis protein
MDQHGDTTATQTALIVDDDDQIRELLQTAVRALGYEVEAAADGQEALWLLAGRSYDVVICGLLMPRMMGDELFRICQEEHLEIASRFVFLSGCFQGLPAADFAATSDQPCLAKPCGLAEMDMVIERVAQPVDATAVALNAL